MLAGKPLSRQMTSEILTAVDEIFTNISSYAYSEKGGTVRLGICAEEKEVRIRFIDAGAPFDPLQGAYPDVSLSIEERKIVGLGIFLVRKLMDNVTYKRQDGCNMLTMIKKYGNKVKKQDGNSR